MVREDSPAEQPAPAASEAPPRPEGRPEERSGAPRPRGGGGGRGGGGRFSRRKVCAFCVDKVDHIDYKDPGKLRRYISERGKIEPRRKTGTCARHQRTLTVAIKRARHIALLPFTAGHARPTGGPPLRREQPRAEAPAEQPAEAAAGQPAEAAADAPALAPEPDGAVASAADVETPPADAEAPPAEVPEQELTEA